MIIIYYSQRINNSKRTYNNTGSNNPKVNIGNNKYKSKIRITNSNKKYIEDREKFNNNGKHHLKTKIIMKEKRAPENIIPTKSIKQSRNISKKSKYERYTKER